MASYFDDIFEVFVRVNVVKTCVRQSNVKLMMYEITLKKVLELAL